MTKTLAAVSFAALLAASPAFAQSSTDQSSTPSTTQNQPATTTTTPSTGSSTTTTTSPSMTKDSSTTTVSPSSDTAATTTGDSTTMAMAGSWRASELIGSSIDNASGEAVGDINDLLLDDQGKVASVVVGVGGFLGMGETNVELKFNELQFSKNQNGEPQIVANVTKESLQAMADKNKASNSSTSTTSSPATTTRPAQ